MGWFPIGLSADADPPGGRALHGVSDEAYFVGHKLLVMPLVVWCCLPLLTRVVLPLYYRLGLSSIYEYLELRYDPRVRVAGTRDLRAVAIRCG